MYLARPRMENAYPALPRPRSSCSDVLFHEYKAPFSTFFYRSPVSLILKLTLSSFFRLRNWIDVEVVLKHALYYLLSFLSPVPQFLQIVLRL
jgi:hypothetical protein